MNSRTLKLLPLRWLAVCLLTLFCLRPALALESIELGAGVVSLSPAPEQLELFQDPADNLRLEDILAGRASFAPVRQQVINLGKSDSSVWVHLRLRDVTPGETVNTWILELAFARLARVDIHLVDNGTLKLSERIGYAAPMSARTLKHNYFAQPLLLEPGRQYDLYLNVMRKGGGIQIPLKLHRATEFSRYVSESNRYYGMYFGIMLAMLIYNSFLMVSVGTRAYLYYILHIIGTFVTFQILQGYAFLYWWPEVPVINEYAIQIAVCLSSMAALLFVRHYVGLHQFAAWMNRVITGMLVLGCSIIAIRLATSQPMIAAAGLFIAGASVLMMTITLICWRNGSRPAGFFLLAWTVFLLGALLHMLTLFGWFPHNTLSSYGVIIGSALEVLLLSLGLADRINAERRARYLALQEKHAAIIDLKEAEAQLVRRAMHSATTGLPNRAFLRSVLDEICVDVTSQPSVALLLIGMNNFHEYNKTLGHSNGDAILCLLAERLDQLLQPQPGLVRIEDNGDQRHHLACIEGVTFAALLRGQSSGQLQLCAQNLLEQIEMPFEFQGLSLNVNAAVGIAQLPDHGENAEDLLRNAHIALEMAANAGGRVAVYSRDMDPYNSRRISLLAELRAAIERDGLQLHLQPQISLQDFSVAGAEVLVRWNHPEHGNVTPAEFIPLAERTGVIHPLTYWVCRKTFELSCRLRAAGHTLGLSINISARNLQATDFTRNIARIATETGVDLHDITMELTETAVMLDPVEALRVMQELAGIGVRLSIDDFGTGYSSLSHLKQLPVDEIKIDRSFVKEMQNSSDDQVIVQTTLVMGHNLGLKVVAEGIEDAATLQQLQQLGCDLAQGYHIARPMPVEDFLRWLERNGRPVSPASGSAGGG